ncbi:unnamed protein product, partial [Meganyctiphanes norvegica]
GARCGCCFLLRPRTKCMMKLSFPHQLVWQAVLLLSLISLQLIHAQVSVCGTKTSCGDCIQVPDCKWCSKLKTNASTTSKVQCFASSKNLSDICFSETSEYVENPEQTEDIIQDQPLTETENIDDSRRPIQLKPQEVNLKLRKGMVYSLEVEYVQAEQYPVDLYYLMDLSNSMKDDKENVAGLGKTIATELLKHTRKQCIMRICRINLPFIRNLVKTLKNPCTAQEPCATPYSFKNDLPLTDKFKQFQIGVDGALISGNIDSPEGGFDGLMQVMKCKNQIGWDDNVRKIVVFSTDASFHFAGDGKLAGVVIPNDEQCHLNNTNEYKDFLEYDYPSVSQINKVAKEENINIIFAIAGAKHRELYTDLSSQIEASSMGILSRSSTDVVDLVVNQYKAISSKIEIKDNTAELGGQLALEVEAKCPRDTDYVKKRSCDNLKTGDRVDLRLNITLLSCKESDPLKLVVQTAQDNITIQVETLCKCNCEMEPNHPLNIKNSTECGNDGSLICGVCDCDQDFYGKNCQCQIGHGHSSSEEDRENCYKDGDEKECSGNGHCSCGQCECKERKLIKKICDSFQNMLFSDALGCGITGEQRSFNNDTCNSTPAIRALNCHEYKLPSSCMCTPTAALCNKDTVKLVKICACFQCTFSGLSRKDSVNLVNISVCNQRACEKLGGSG